MSTIAQDAAKRAEMDILQRKQKDALPRPRTVKEVSSERVAEKLLEAMAPKTGYPELDRLIKGFVPGHLYTLSGDTNVGKTTLACNFAIRVAKQGKKVLYFALEPENTVVDYLASVRTDKTFGELTHEDLAEDDGNIAIFGKTEVSKVDDLIRIIKLGEEAYDLIIIDHIGYFVTTLQNTLQEQSNVIKKLAALAKEKQTAVMMIAHLRKRDPKSKGAYAPSSDDIAGSASFKQDSTEVLLVTRKYEETENDEATPVLSNEGRLFVMKTKSGPNGIVDLEFQPGKANIRTFEEKQDYVEAARSAFFGTRTPPPGSGEWVPTYGDGGQLEDNKEMDDIF